MQAQPCLSTGAVQGDGGRGGGGEECCRYIESLPLPLEVWRAKKNFSLSRGDLQHLLDQLNAWFNGGMLQ